MGKGFIKDINILEEDYRKDDLLDLSKTIKNFRNTLDKINNNSTIGLVGEFGTGKSTMLYQLYKDKTDEDDEKWIYFDAWKFPERKELWEGFVLEVSRKIDKKTFEKVRKSIDGKKNDDKKILVNTIGDIFRLPVIKNLNHFFDTSPARRVFEIQEIFKKTINNIDKNLYIIVEDIDRSGDKGKFFIETLRHFIKENNFKRKITIIIPISNKNFNDEKPSYLKCLDRILYFNLKDLDFSEFIKFLLLDKFTSIQNLIPQINFLFKSFVDHEGATIRDIKHIIRTANLEYQKALDREEKLDIRVLIAFAFLEFFDIKKISMINGEDALNFHNDSKKQRIGIFLKMVSHNFNKNEISKTCLSKNIFLTNHDYYIPKLISHSPIDSRDTSKYYLSNKYLKYF